MLYAFEENEFGRAWESLLHSLVTHGMKVNPRGNATLELRNVLLRVNNGRSTILLNEARRLNYRFMVAEWLWIWFGRDDVATIKKYNKVIVQFSDDGISFNGAYGKAIMPSWPYAMSALQHDENTRQSVIQIYRQPTRKTKDVACTLSYQFLLREGKLHLTVTMRSSDIWLGLPYDMFNASMLLNIAAGQLNVDIGSVTFSLASSHLYMNNYDKAIEALSQETRTIHSHKLPGSPPQALETALVEAPLSRPHAAELSLESPWDCYELVLSETDHPFECHPLLGHKI